MAHHHSLPVLYSYIYCSPVLQTAVLLGSVEGLHRKECCMLAQVLILRVAPFVRGRLVSVPLGLAVRYNHPCMENCELWGL